MACDLDNYLKPATFSFKFLQVKEVNKLHEVVTSFIFSKFLTKEESTALADISNDIAELGIKTLNLSTDPEAAESDFGWVKISREFHGMRAIIVANSSSLPQCQKSKLKRDLQRFTKQS